MSHDITAKQMYWKPELLQLTQISHPEIDGGVPTPCFLDPQSILSINRAKSSFSKADSTGSLREYHPQMDCTCVMTTYGHALMVTEAPNVIAMLRDKALGYQRGPKKA